MRKTILMLSLLFSCTLIYQLSKAQCSTQCNGQVNESDSIVISRLFYENLYYWYFLPNYFEDFEINVSEICEVRFVEVSGECRIDSLNLYCQPQTIGADSIEINLPFLKHLYIGDWCYGTLDFDQFNKTNFPLLKTLKINYTHTDINTLDLNLPSLEELILINAIDSDIIIPDFSNMPNLKKLKINRGKLSGELPDFSNLKNLEILHITSTQIDGAIPNFSKLPKLRSLILKDNQLSGAIPNFNNIPFLEELDLSQNLLTGVIPNFSNLPLLSEFEICYNSPFGSDETNDLIGPIPKLDNCPLVNTNGVNFSCVRLALENTGCLISESDSLELVNFYQATNGDNWQVNNGWLTENVNSWWGIELKDTLGECRVNKILIRGIPDAVELPALNLPFLEEMILDYNNFTGNLPNLDNLTNLKILNLEANNFTGSLPDLNNLTQLEVINLSQNQLADEISEFSNQPNLRILDLSDNQLSGQLPNFDNNPELSQLNVSRNQLNSNIPIQLGNSNLFKNLNIAYNYFLCNDIQSNLFQQLDDFSYLPQLFKPTNYNDIKNNVFDTLTVDRSLNLVIKFPFNTDDLTYQWYRNDIAIPGATQDSLNFDTIQPQNVGKYILQVYRNNCLPDGNDRVNARKYSLFGVY